MAAEKTITTPEALELLCIGIAGAATMQWGYDTNNADDIGSRIAQRALGTIGLATTVTSFSLITDKMYQNSGPKTRGTTSLTTAFLGAGAFTLSQQETLSTTMQKALSLASTALESHSVLSAFGSMAGLIGKISNGITESCCRRRGMSPPRKEQLEAVLETILGTATIAAFNTAMETASAEETEIMEQFFTRFCATVALMMAVPAYDKFARTIMHSENAAKGFVWGAITAIGGAILSQAATQAESEIIENTLQAIAVAAETETVHALFPTARKMWRTIAEATLNPENYCVALRSCANTTPAFAGPAHTTHATKIELAEKESKVVGRV